MLLYKIFFAKFYFMTYVRGARARKMTYVIKAKIKSKIIRKNNTQNNKAKSKHKHQWRINDKQLRNTKLSRGVSSGVWLRQACRGPVSTATSASTQQATSQANASPRHTAPKHQITTKAVAQTVQWRRDKSARAGYDYDILKMRAGRFRYNLRHKILIMFVLF